MMDFFHLKNIVIIGVGGTIGRALVAHYLQQPGVETITTFSRSPQVFSDTRIVHHCLHYDDESQLAQAASRLDHLGGVDAIFVTTGVLHNDEIAPEKSLKDMTFSQFESIFMIDTAVPAMLVKHFSSQLHQTRPAVIAVLSARVGSISDNRLGGWYAYRCAKAALHMFVKSAAIEMKRRYRHQMIVALHPGTVQSPLSAPYTTRMDASKIFSPEVSAAHLAKVVAGLSPEQSGQIIAWDGQVIDP